MKHIWKKLILLAAISASLPALHAYSALLTNTYEGDSRYDVKKLFDGQDDDLCWAFSASNAIYYWQTLKSLSGIEIPTGTPNGTPTSSYSSDIAKTFVDNWVNDGGEETDAFDWWFTGKVDDESALKPGASGGGYWKNTPYSYGETSLEIEFGRDTSSYSSLINGLNDAIRMEYALTCGIYMTDGGAHAMTLWGYELDDITDQIVGLWICDSDNAHLGNFLVDLTWDNEDMMWYLGDSSSGTDYSGWYLGDISMLIASIPEPSAYAILFGAAVLVFAIRKRLSKS